MVRLADLQEPVHCFSKFDTFLEMERRGKPRMLWARPMTFNFAPSRGMLNDNEMILSIMASSNLFRRAILLQQTPRQHMHLWAGCLTVTPGRRGSRQKY
jgi:hypothetical protein